MTQEIENKAETYEKWLEISHEGYRLSISIRNGDWTRPGIIKDEAEAREVSERINYILHEHMPFDSVQSEITKQYLAELRNAYPKIALQLPQFMAWARLSDDGS